MRPPAQVSRVLVGVDFDDASAAALKMAAALASAWHAEITVLHAATAEAPVYFTADQIAALAVEREQRRTDTADQVRSFAEQQQVPRDTRVVVEEGPPQDAILRLADAFDLVVLGTHRRRGALRWWLGSVAEAVVHQSPSPVLVVPADAGGGPLHDAARIVAAAGADRAADAWAGRLRTAFTEVAVLPAPSGDVGTIAQLLKDCVHPVLFVPSMDGTVERSSS